MVDFLFQMFGKSLLVLPLLKYLYKRMEHQILPGVFRLYIKEMEKLTSTCKFCHLPYFIEFRYVLLNQIKYHPALIERIKIFKKCVELLLISVPVKRTL